MIEPMDAKHLPQVGHEDVEKRLALMTEELSRANKAIQEKSRQLEQLTASFEALEAANEKLRRFDELRWAFWTIE
jgi:chromosome segregation ATPase